MIVEQAISTVLDTVAGCDFHPVQLPDGDTIPAVFGIYSKVGGEAFGTLDGDSECSQVRMQVSIYSTSYGTLKAKEAAVIAAMRSANADRSLVNRSASVPIDGFDPETRRFYVHCDFYCFVGE